MPSQSLRPIPIPLGTSFLTEISHFMAGMLAACLSRYRAKQPHDHQVKREGTTMLVMIVLIGTYVAGVWLIRLVWWQE